MWRRLSKLMISPAIDKTHRPCGPESKLSPLNICHDHAAEALHNAMMLLLKAQLEVCLQCPESWASESKLKLVVVRQLGL